MHFSCQFVLSFFAFLEFSRNRLTALNTCQVKHAPKPIFLGFSYESPGGCMLFARRHELGFLVLGLFWSTIFGKLVLILYVCVCEFECGKLPAS